MQTLNPLKSHPLPLAAFLVVLLGSALAAGAAWAAGPPGPPCQGQGPGPGDGWGPHGPGEMGVLRNLPDDIALTDQQKTEIRQVMDQARTTMDPLMASRDEKQKAVFDAMHAVPVDETAIRSAVQTLSGVDADIAVARAQTHAQVMSLLTQQQKDYVAQQIQERQQQRESNRGTMRDFHRQRRQQRFGGGAPQN
ncbi:MAG TPA: periplasmic heavy metal sensor [Candidatus Saccharimonadales bacterium]|nr:periplasmic heavy metal sensor [Candidatus Saccharimonadales bacterium]